MRLLVIDNHRDKDCEGAPMLRQALSASQGHCYEPLTLFTRRAPERDLPFLPESYDQIIISGSRTSIFSEEPWVPSLIQFTKRALDLRIPILGVCYGHQILGLCLGGKLGRCAEPQEGFKEVEVLDSSSLFRDMPSHFPVYCQNREEIKELPKGTRVLARSQECALEAFQVEETCTFGVQFHPEQSDPINLKIFENFLSL